MNSRWRTMLLAGGLLAACGQGELSFEGEEKRDEGAEGQAFTSARATQLDFDFKGELVVASGFWSAKEAIDAQLLYTIGHLNGEQAVGRLDKLALSEVQTTTLSDGSTQVSYRAKLPVAWGSKTNLPSAYSFQLPRRMDYAGLEAFTQKYSHDCVDGSAHDVTSGSMWYYYRPKAYRCQLAADDVVTLSATVARSSENTSGKYPEYHKVWEDGALQVVAIFGKYEDGATSGDAGISAYNAFVRSMRAELAAFGLVTTPASVPVDPGVAVPDITFEATLADGKKVKVTALLVDNVRTAGAAFDARYAALSTRADLISYSGHAGLGANVRALARKGSFVAGQYLMVFMNGCDTFAYVDGYLADARRQLNPDDPTGTKYLEIVTNAMPAYFSSMSNASLALIRGLLHPEAPKTYEQLFTAVDGSQVVVVTGEEDNVYFPGYPGPGPTPWAGLSESGEVQKGEEKRFETPLLPAGKYLFELSGSGDADLYVRANEAPTTSRWDCRPYRSGSSERCTLSLAAPAKVHLMVRGWAARSAFQLSGKPQP